MPRHSLFPNSISITYTSNGHTHKQVLPVKAVTPVGASWTLETRDASDIDWKTAVDAYALLMAEFLDTASSIDYAELFTYEATDSPAEFLAAHSIAQAGLHASAAQDFVQFVMPFKAIGGNSLRLTIMEGSNPEDIRESFGGSTSPEFCGMAEFILSDDDWIITRGGTFPNTSLGYTTKINDKLRERYFLD